MKFNGQKQDIDRLTPILREMKKRDIIFNYHLRGIESDINTNGEMRQYGYLYLDYDISFQAVSDAFKIIGDEIYHADNHIKNNA